MVVSTTIARVVDGLLLAASMDDQESVDLSEFKTMAKQILKRLTYETETRCSIEAPPFVFHYMIEFGVCYLVLCEKSYPKKLAFAYLEELQKEFQDKYGHEIGTVARPYAFVKFDSFIQKTKRQYLDARATRNLQKMNEDLQDVRQIMTKNISEVLGRGEQLNRMGDYSEKLKTKSKEYFKDTKKLHLQALYQKYGPPLIVVTIILLVFYIRIFWW